MNFAVPTAKKSSDEEYCNLDCFIKGLSMTIDMGDQIAFGDYLVPNLTIHNMALSMVSGTVDDENNPQAFTATLQFSSIDMDGYVIVPSENNRTMGSFHAGLVDASLGFKLGFENYEYAGYKLISGTNPEFILDLNLGSAKIDIKCIDCTVWESMLTWLIDGLVSLFKSLIGSILKGYLDDLNTLIKGYLDPVFQNINSNYTEKFINQTHPLDIPVEPGMMNLTESSLIDMIAWATTELLGGNSTLGLNSLITRFTKGTGNFVVGSRDDTFEELSDLILDAMTFNNNTIPDINGTIDFALTYLELTGLNTWNNLKILDPLRYSNKYGTDIPMCEVEEKCDYQLKISSGLSHFGIKLKFALNASADSAMISTGGKKIHEEATFEVVTEDNYMEGRFQLGIYDEQFEKYSNNMLTNMTCWGALIDHNCTGIPSLMFNTTIPKIALTAASAYLEDGVQDIINAIADVFIYNYAPVIPAFLNGLFNSLATTYLNDMIQDSIQTQCDDDPDPNLLEYKPVAVATTLTLSLVIGAILAAIAIIFMVIKWRNTKNGKTTEYNYNDSSMEYSSESNSDEETMKTIQDETVDENISSDTEDPLQDVENMVEGGAAVVAGKKSKKSSSKSTDGQKKPKTKKRGFCKKMFCSPKWFFRQFLRTDPDGASMFLDERIPIVVRIIMPVILFLNMAVFVISNSGTGATVNAYILFGDNNMITMPVSDFGLINSVTDMWDAGVYPLSILIMVFSGIWPYTKLAMMLVVWMTPTKIVSTKSRGKILHFLDSFGKWSFLDSYVMTLMIVAFFFDVPLPIKHTESVIAPFGIKLYVDAALGFVLLMTGTMISLLLSHIVVWIHDALIADKSDYYGREAQKWKPLMMYAKNWFVRITVLIGIILSFGLVVVGLFIQSFAFDFYGLAGWALDVLGNSTHRDFSLLDLGIDLPGASREPDSFTTYFIQAIYFVTVVVMPILHHIFLLIYWLCPLNRRMQYVVQSICDILYAWACMDVFIISVIAAVVELSQFAAFMVEPMCSAPMDAIGGQTLDDLIGNFFGTENLIEGHETCFEVAAALEGGCWCLFASVVIYSIVSYTVSHIGRNTLVKRLPKEDEREEFYQNEALKKADVKPLLNEEVQ